MFQGIWCCHTDHTLFESSSWYGLTKFINWFFKSCPDVLEIYVYLYVIYLSVWVKIRQIVVPILKRGVHSSSNFVSFYIVMIDNSSLNFKIIHFLFWINGFHQSLNFETFKWSGENLPYSSRHFPNYKSLFFQILHNSSLS